MATVRETPFGGAAMMLILCALLGFGRAVSAQPHSADAQLEINTREDLIRVMTLMEDDLAAMVNSHEAGLEAARRLAKLALGLSRRVESVAKIAAAVETGEGSTANLLNAMKAMQEMNMQFNLQYLELQENMQHENRQFTMMSNIMKVKHDTSKSSINNIR